MNTMKREKMKYLFVYGSLMKNEPASHILENCKYCGKYILHDYAMYNLGQYPGIVPHKGESVVGEVYEISEVLIPKLDKHEGEGSLYIRKTVSVSKADKQIFAMSYIYNQDIKEKELLREGWNSKESDYVWYASYGSNLSNERFLYYIKGGYYPQTGKEYSGCNDKRMWISEQFKKYPGKMYFAKQSSSWENKGVAFYNPESTGFTYMKLFKITRKQFHEIQKQEGPSWYGRIVCLDILEDNCPVYTITNEKKLEDNEPCEKYLNLIRESLVGILGEEKQVEIENYLDGCLSEVWNKTIKVCTVEDGIYQAYKLQAEKAGNIVRVFDEYNNFQFDLTDEKSIEECRNAIKKIDSYEWGYDFDLFYKFFVLGEACLPCVGRKKD